MTASKERRVIVLGASPKRARFSNKAVRCYRELGYEVVPVHPLAKEVEGLAVYPTIADVPGEAELLLSYVRPELAISAMEEAAKKGVRRVFLNPGADGPTIAAKIRELGMEPVEDCAIVAVGRSPAEFPES
ncbi:MAG: CoA-binding protein [Candidatus Eisenbacteria bacterium]